MEGDRDESCDKPTGKAGVIVADPDASSVDTLAHAVLDDLLYNLIADLCLQTHREEKMAKMNTAAINVEKLAVDASESTSPDARPQVRVETDAAIYDDGSVYLKGNPLKTTKEIICPRCQLPRLLHPTEGKGWKKMDAQVQYCKKHPFIDKPGCDIYGQTWIGPGPGRGKKKKDMEKDGPDTPASVDKAKNVLSFPSATCHKCKRCILVTRLNNHMGSCIGNSGRNASRAAAQKIGNGGSDPTPPSSQKATPAPGSRAASPRKRDVSEEGGDSEDGHKKKKAKPNANNAKKVILKTKGSFKKDMPKGSSSLSQETKADYDLPTEVAPKKAMATKLGSPAKKLKPVKPPTSNNSPLVKNRGEADAESESSGTPTSSH